MKEEKNLTAVGQPTVSERFTSLVMREFAGSVGEINMGEFQKSLIQGYFIGCDNALAAAEAKRQKDNKSGVVPYTWANVDVNSKLAQNIVIYAKLGLDMTMANHLFAIPRLNGKTGKYEFTFQEGYKGKEIKAKKYSLYEIVNITAELVYANDKFAAHKKDANHAHDTYEFEITNAFDRGALIGGFAYIEFDDPQRNALFIMSKADIEKRKAKAMNTVFWNQWYDEMALKTVIAAACSKKVTLDPKKIDDDYRSMQMNEMEAEERSLAEEIAQNANSETIDVVASAPPDVVAEDMDKTCPAPEALSREDMAALEKIEF